LIGKFAAKTFRHDTALPSTARETTTLAVVREGAEANGYRVEGFAPTSGAAARLGESGIETSTLQMHLAKRQSADTGEKTLCVVDKSSLASTK
jgi:hypothetical protein